MQNRNLRRSDAALRLRLLGPMQVDVAGNEVGLAARKARGLLAYVALRPGVAVPRETLRGLLWGDRGEEQARASLRQTLSAVRKALGKMGATSLVATQESVTLAPDDVWVDVMELEGAAEASSPEELAAAAELYRGDLIEGLSLNEPAFDQWLAGERERARVAASRVLKQLVELLEAEQRLEEAIVHGSKLLALDPLQEGVHRTLMRLYMAQGRYDAALSQFEQCRQELSDQLGVQPEKATLDLVAEIRAKRFRTREKTSKPDHVSVSAGESMVEANAAPALPDKPSIAVLPFTNMSGDPEQEYFSEGITEDIITELSRFPELFIIGRNSSFAYKSKPLKVGDIARDLGVAYIVEGSVRKAGNRIRVTAQLIEASSGNHIWAERYDRDLMDIFELQDDLSSSIVSTTAGRLEVDLTKRAAIKPTSNLSAYECVLRGQSLVHRYTKEDLAKARTFFEQAVSLDPEFARAYGWLAYVEGCNLHYWQMSVEGMQHAVQIGKRGLALDDHDSKCHLALGMSYLFLREHDKAEHHLLKASSLNPNDDLIMIELGRFKIYTNQPLEGAELVRRAMRQNPYHPNWYWNVLVRCLHTAKDYWGALAALERLQTVPYWSHAYFAACYAALDQPEEAKKHVDMVLSLKPDFTLKQFENVFPYREPAVRMDFLESLRRAGLP